jgi:hypothetical protein
MKNKTIRLRLSDIADQALKRLLRDNPEITPTQIMNQLLLDAVSGKGERYDISINRTD